MANNCDTHYIIECENQSKLDRIYEAVAKVNHPDYPQPQDGATPYWTGNIFRELGLKYENDRSFWYAVDFIDDALHIYEDAAWTRGSAMSQLVEQMNDPDNEDDTDLIVYFYTEEPGCEIYESNDDCNIHFTAEYVLDTAEDTEYYDDFLQLLSAVSDHVGQQLNFVDYDDLKDYLEDYNEQHQDDELWAHVHEIDYNASLWY